jgi:hypothetical protein
MEVMIGLVQPIGLGTEEAHLHAEPGAAEPIEAEAANPGVGVPASHHHPGEPGGEDRPAARGGEALVVAWLEGYVEGRPARPDSRACDRHRFGVGMSPARVIALPHDSPAPHDQSTHEWIGMRAAAAGEDECPTHPAPVPLD